MADVSAQQITRWRSGQHVGENKPAQRVAVRRGRFRRRYAPWEGEDFSGIQIRGESDSAAWYASWEGMLSNGDGTYDFADWVDLENVLQVDITQDFDSNGIQRATITLENIFLVEKAAHSPLSGVWHLLDRGHFSPFRGFQPPNQSKTTQTKNFWYEKLFRNAQVMVWQGYGADDIGVTFTGLIDDVDIKSKPDQIVLSLRDFGQQFVDCRIFNFNKSPQIEDPVVFADSKRADDVTRVGAAGPSDCSSHEAGHPARFVTDSSHSTRWIAAGYIDRTHTEWVQIRLPAGRYENFEFEAGIGGQEVFFAVHVRPQDDGSPATLNGLPLTSPGWLNIDKGEVVDSQSHPLSGEGVGGRVPWFRHVGQTDVQRHTFSFGGTLRCGNGSELVAFCKRPQRDLDGRYFASVSRFRAVKRRLKAEAKKNKWILCDDVTDVVKCIFRWAGFKEWVVEKAGVRITDPVIFNRGNFMIDPITALAETIGFEFFMGDPTSEDSIGVPVFRANSALRTRNAPSLITGRAKKMLQVRDIDLLTGVEVKLSDQNLAYIIRVRGARASAEHGGHLLGGGDDGHTRRKMFVYRPPWTTQERMGGQIKHEIVVNEQLKTQEDCEIACYLIAAAQALKSATALVQIPAMAFLELDDQIYLVDSSTGLATRLWIAQRSSTFKAGAEAEWSMSLGGALIDTPDIVEIKAAIRNARAAGKRMPPVLENQINPSPVAVGVDL